MNSDMINQARDEVISEHKYRNGLNVLVGGIAMMILCLALLTTYSLFALYIPLFFLHRHIRKHIIIPRIGYAQLNLKRTGKKELLILLSAMTLFVVLGMIIALGSFHLSFRQQFCGAFVAFGAAYMIFIFITVRNREKSSSLQRVNLAALLLIMTGSVFFNPSDLIITCLFLAFGAANTVAGSILLKRFMKTHPVVQDEN